MGHIFCFSLNQNILEQFDTNLLNTENQMQYKDYVGLADLSITYPKVTIFWKVKLHSLFKAHQHFERQHCCHLHSQRVSETRSTPLAEWTMWRKHWFGYITSIFFFLMLSFLTYSLTLKMEALFFSKMLVDFQQAT